MYSILIWLSLSIIFILLELLIPGLFYFLSFAVGSGAAAIFSIFSENLILQLVIFTAISILVFLALNMWVKDLPIKTENLSNTQALIGKSGIVTETILSHQKGLVKVQGEIWSARSTDSSRINIGDIVRIKDIKGSHLIVKKIDN